MNSNDCHLYVGLRYKCVSYMLLFLPSSLHCLKQFLWTLCIENIGFIKCILYQQSNAAGYQLKIHYTWHHIRLEP